MPRRTPRRPGRPISLTTEGHTRLLQAIRAGVPTTYAADYAGIGARTLHRYLARGEDADIRQERGEHLTPDDEWMRQIWLEVSRARAEVAVRGVALIQKVAGGGHVIKETTRTYRDPETGRTVTETEKQYAPPDARPMQWLLERTHRDSFGKTAQQVEVVGPDGTPIEVGGSALAVDLADRVAALAAARRAEIEASPLAEVVVDAEVVEERSAP